MIVYIAGAVSEDFNYREKFAKKERELQKMGHVVLNPAVLPPGLKNHEDYMKICYAMLDAVDAAYFLQGWENSTGAKLEREYCKEKNISTYQEEKDTSKIDLLLEKLR